MQSQPTLGHLAPTASGVLVVDGYGVRIRVERGRLVVADGIGRARRSGQFDRATSRLRRLVLLGHTGSITIDAFRWLSDVGVGFTAIDADGRVLLASAGMGRDDPRLRRAQALAIDTTVGDDIARRLLAEKIAGQAATLAGAALVEVSDATVTEMRRAAGLLHVATNRDELRLAEAQAAAAYWSACTYVPLRFTKADVGRVPTHWVTLGARRSPLTGNQRLAANPANAVLNYLYAILEAEARLACLAVGLDPGLGVLHADLKARDSLALDVMEVVRPQVDAFVFDMLARQVFRAADFHETRQGACRVLAPLSHLLAATAPRWAAALGPMVEQVTRMLVEGTADPRGRQPTPLTGDNRSAGRPEVGRRPKVRDRRTYIPGPFLRHCERCGGKVPRPERKLCEACLPTSVAERRTKFAVAGRARLDELRAQGLKPGVGGAAGRTRARKVGAAKLANAEWDRNHPDEVDPADFGRAVLPLLAGLTVGPLVTATGLSRGYCAQILSGNRVPHPRWWDRLGLLGTEQVGARGRTRDDESDCHRDR